jgi:DNA-binding transcriptional regulator LsrR (DeoR family)
MRDIVASPPGDPDDDLYARAVWLYYGAGMTQGDVARRLSIPSVKAHRLIARANRLGLVRVTIDAPISSCMQLESALKTKFGLDQCVVAPKN